jgi:hypothetical protein
MRTYPTIRNLNSCRNPAKVKTHCFPKRSAIKSANLRMTHPASRDAGGQIMRTIEAVIVV